MKINIFLKLSFIFSIIALISICSNFLLINNEKEILAQGIWQTTEEKCVINAVIANGFEMGKIPIGETVDYAELYAREIIRNLNILIVNTEKEANTAYSEKAEDDLYDIPPQIKCSKCEAALIVGVDVSNVVVAQIVEKNALLLNVFLRPALLKIQIKVKLLLVNVVLVVFVTGPHVLPVIALVLLIVVAALALLMIAVVGETRISITVNILALAQA